MSRYQQYVNEAILKGWNLAAARGLANSQLVQEEMQKRLNNPVVKFTKRKSNVIQTNVTQRSRNRTERD